MTTLRFVLGDHLTRSVSSLADIDRRCDVVLMVEAWEEASYVPHHKQKIAFVLSAMRHFANELRAEGIAVDYVKLDDPANTGSFTGELLRAVARYCPDNVVVTEPGEWRVLAVMQHWQSRTGVPVHIREDDRFFASRDRFALWASRRKTYRMEHFYREMRRETGFLMKGGQPVGGRWNFDADNRKRLPSYIRPPQRRRFEPDMTTLQVLALVEANFAEHFGDTESFGWPVTRSEALSALEDFVSRYLPQFGTYQDAMRVGEPFLYHALLSAAMNVGLLTPREVCARAELAYLDGHAPLNATEGFIRQILGWREFIRGLYWQKMPAYAETNALGAQRNLPWFYWSGETSMRCLAFVIEQTRRYAYSHHIQRLMVTGNFALWQACNLGRLRNGISRFMSMPLNGWSYRTHMEWPCSRMAACSHPSPMQRRELISIACRIFAPDANMTRSSNQGPGLAPSTSFTGPSLYVTKVSCPGTPECDWSIAISRHGRRNGGRRSWRVPTDFSTGSQSDRTNSGVLKLK